LKNIVAIDNEVCYNMWHKRKEKKMNPNKVFIKPDYSVACIEYKICLECDNGITTTLARCYDSNLAEHIRKSVLEYLDNPIKIISKYR
jgi:hypothetical protein